MIEQMEFCEIDHPQVCYAINTNGCPVCHATTLRAKIIRDLEEDVDSLVAVNGKLMSELQYLRESLVEKKRYLKGEAHQNLTQEMLDKSN